MRRSRIALLAVSGSLVLVLSAIGAFVIGHGAGTRERIEAMRARELASLANMTKATFQGWSLVCRDAPSNGSPRRCVLFMAVAEQATGQVLLTFSITRAAQGAPVLLIETPAGVAVDQGITVAPSSAQSVKVGIHSCGPQRCRAIAELSPSLQAALETADITSVTYVQANRQLSTYNLPTRGFREGFAAWSAETARLSKSAAVN
jgi:invasion protein IalB